MICGDRVTNEVIEFLFDAESLDNQFKSTYQVDKQDSAILGPHDALLRSQKADNKVAIESVLNESALVAA